MNGPFGDWPDNWKERLVDGDFRMRVSMDGMIRDAIDRLSPWHEELIREAVDRQCDPVLALRAVIYLCLRRGMHAFIGIHDVVDLCRLDEAVVVDQCLAQGWATNTRSALNHVEAVVARRGEPPTRSIGDAAAQWAQRARTGSVEPYKENRYRARWRTNEGRTRCRVFDTEDEAEDFLYLVVMRAS